MITSVLVANRGEIARRVFRTARSLGVQCVAVHSTADSLAPYVGEADAAVHLPGTAPGDTYLRGELVIQAALKAGADAVHPGYGFLSESAGFAAAVIEAGLTWIGPPVEAISSMGSKIEAKKLMAAAGVPVLAELTPAEVSASDLPVLVKASAGGGGRGMRVVRRLEDLAAEIDAASAEALSAFGDGTVFCERYLATGRHIEVQVLADQHGTIWAVGERECSIQRRHQKVVEEAPSPLVERLPWMRSRLFEAARKAAEAIGYVGAGTVEFLADEEGGFYFLEMNTRLQVEHPVTESTTGLDLVALQFAVAAGEALPAEPPAPVGHSIEVRLYAEDPANDWQPQTGTLHRFAVEGAGEGRRMVAPGRAAGVGLAGAAVGPAGLAGVAEFTAGGPREGAPWVRVDSGVVSGSEVSPYYDAMVAKVIVWGSTREQAAARLAAELQRAEIHGVLTNRDLLVWILRHPAFLAGDTDTSFFDKRGIGPAVDEAAERVAAVVAALADAASRKQRATVQRGLPGGWRNLASQPQRKSFRVGDSQYDVEYRRTRDGLTVDGAVVVEATAERVVLEVDGVRRPFGVAAYPGLVCVGPVALTPVERFPDPSQQLAVGALVAPMPGSVVRVGVAVGDKVTRGQGLVWLEAMKMEHTISAPADGVVTELAVAAGQQVEVGMVLAVVQVEEDA
ncbi:biotin carboxylase N-terminal domain-containing protein [Kribbella catacumbae]|uniref:ATP-binding protein n=1 Tax=Kribbella catacumbae TaxID=460086 RepID=UPI000365870F|nr:biotin carboxylase N-terminal domain-containing protein [Kribbella catacumbae]